MKHLKDKKVVLAITGSIAAYKAAFLVRLLVKAGATVKVLMSESAEAFISPLTLSTLSKNEVLTGLVTSKSWNNHVDLGLWADIMLIAPATANTLARLANGHCSSLIDAVYLSARCPVFIAPAMDVDMWEHPAVRTNVSKLQSYGNYLISVEEGELASGLIGKGRLAEPEKIVHFLEDYFTTDKPLRGVNFLITAGPTHEPIDPVRFIGNRSSGKMGLALASEALAKGAKVNLVLGPSALQVPDGIMVHRVQTAEEMFAKVMSLYDLSDVNIFAAAVADYSVKESAQYKIKKQDLVTLELVENPDIALAAGARKKPEQLNIGFALETNEEEFHAKSKLTKKNFDFIVLNSLNDKGAGFGGDTNKVSIFHRNGEQLTFPLKSKQEVAVDIIKEVIKLRTLSN